MDGVNKDADAQLQSAAKAEWQQYFYYTLEEFNFPSINSNCKWVIQ